ncbi:uncharacterized protein A4U43_C01F19050 [Asparagus officinalis]|uniref:Uncharacterized protein n=1 Tax=Asparagus officinalis TaxID=4686 RepID=A0A5P1FU66_ASPOF|nr:uncharacterized protein A4U43_C01F19050 [Asparagus officinalis]
MRSKSGDTTGGCTNKGGTDVCVMGSIKVECAAIDAMEDDVSDVHVGEIDSGMANFDDEKKRRRTSTTRVGDEKKWRSLTTSTRARPSTNFIDKRRGL